MTLTWQTALPLNHKAALLAMSDWANDDGSSLHPSIYAVAERLTCSERTAQRLLKDLIDERWLAVVGNLNGGKPGATRHYRINVRKLRERAAVEDARRSAERANRAPRQNKEEMPDPFATGDNLSGVTGDKLARVTTDEGTGDNAGTGRVTVQAETGDTLVTLSTIEPPVEPPKEPLQPAKPAAAKVKTASVDEQETEKQAACRSTWVAYSEAFERRYGTKPVRNQSVNSKVKQFVERIGHDESPAVAAFYVDRVSDSFVVRKVHDIGQLLASAEGYRTQWASGAAMTGTRAQQIDQSQSNYDAAGEAMAILRQRRAGAPA